MKNFKFLIILFFLSVNAFAQNSTGWQTIYESNIGKIDMMVTINDPNAKKSNWTTGVYFRTNIPYFVQISVYCKEITSGFGNEGRTEFNSFLNSTVFSKSSGWRETDVLPNAVKSFKGAYIHYLQIENQVLFRNGQEISQFYYNTNGSTNSSTTNQNNSTNNSNFKDFTDLVNEHNRVCQELMNTANSSGKNSNLLVKYCQQGGTFNDNESNRIRIKNEINEMNNEIHNLKYSNNSGSTGTSSMNRNDIENTGWNGNNGNSNNNYNQQIQNQNSKTTEAFDLYNSTGNYEEARRKLIEAKNNAPDEASRQVAQQNIDKLDKVERKNQNVETISKTIDFTTDLIKTMREENKKNIVSAHDEVEKNKKENLKKVKFYTNQLDNQLIKISNLESNKEKKIEDYLNLINEYKILRDVYHYLGLYKDFDSIDEETKYKEYIDNKIDECHFKSNQLIVEIYEKRLYLPRDSDIVKYKILGIENELLLNKIIDKLKIDVDKGNGKSAYEIAFFSCKKINEILKLSEKELSVDDINKYLQKLKYYLDLEFNYLNIASEKQIKEAVLVKNAYKIFGWYKEPRNVMEAQNAFKELINNKTVDEKYFSSVNFNFVENPEKIKTYNPITQEFYNKIMDIIIDKFSKFSVTKQLKNQFDDALLDSGITKIPNIEFTKLYVDSSIKYEIGNVYFDSNHITIVPNKLEILLLFEKFDNNIKFNDYNLYETIEENEIKFYGWMKNKFSFRISKEKNVINSYFFKLITNQIKN